jgi:hypothetical protein
LVFNRNLDENRVLRRIFGPKRNEVTGEWRKLHNEELHDLYEIGGACSTNGENRNSYMLLVGNQRQGSH